MGQQRCGCDIEGWASRHLVHLVDDDTKWIVEINNDGPVKLYSVGAVDAAPSLAGGPHQRRE
jgi:hypothetical protein